MDLLRKKIEAVKKYFKETGACTAVLGISGGKDSTVAAALLTEAFIELNENPWSSEAEIYTVLGVMMPNGVQADIADSERLCKFLEDRVKPSCWFSHTQFNIEPAYKSILSQIVLNGRAYSEQTSVNLAPRLRMSTLYAISQSMYKSRVCCTSNKCELFLGYGTLYGDIAGDFAPLADLTVSEVRELGMKLGLPEDLVMKTPTDGLPVEDKNGNEIIRSDEDKLGVTYEQVEKFIKYHEMGAYVCPPDQRKAWERIQKLHDSSEFKRKMWAVPII